MTLLLDGVEASAPQTTRLGDLLLNTTREPFSWHAAAQSLRRNTSPHKANQTKRALRHNVVHTDHYRSHITATPPISQ